MQHIHSQKTLLEDIYSNNDLEDYNMETKTKSTSQTKSDTPLLDKFTTDFTKLARDGKLDPVVGRTDELKRIAQILSRRKKNNPRINW